MPLIQALQSQRQVDFCEFKASLVYIGSFMTGPKATQRNTFSKKIINEIIKILRVSSRWEEMHSGRNFFF